MNKNLSLIVLSLAMAFTACQSTPNKKEAKAETATETQVKAVTANATVGIYYFHGDRKCKTCKVVGKTAKEVVEKMSADKLSVQFFDVNLDETGNESIAKEFEASGSSLYIKNHKSGKIEDLTSFAFRNAINDAPAYIVKLETAVKAELN